MSHRTGVLRRLAIWAGPVLMILLVIISGFVYWLLTTPAGARLAFNAAMPWLGGSASGVQGSVWDGLDVEHLYLPLEAVTVDAQDVSLRMNWKALLTAQVHVTTFSVGSLDIDIHPTDEPEPPSTEPFTMPELPVTIRIDHAALGNLDLATDGEALPVHIRDLALSAELDAERGGLRLDSLEVGDSLSVARLDGHVELQKLTEPWPAEADFRVSAHALSEQSPLCVHQYLDTLPSKPESEHGAAAMATAILQAPQRCPAHADLNVHGSLQSAQLKLDVQGQDIVLESQVHLTPLAEFPFRDGWLALDLADGSGLRAELDWQPAQSSSGSRVQGWLTAKQLDIAQLAGGLLPPAVLEADGNFDLSLSESLQLEMARIELTLDEGSQWQKEPLNGVLNLAVDSPRRHDDRRVARPADRAATVVWEDFHLHQLDMDIHLGDNEVTAHGSFGSDDDAWSLSVAAPRLASFWPDLPGGLMLDLELDGSVQTHGLKLHTRYTPPDAQDDTLGRAPMAATLSLDGGWHQQPGASVGAWLASVDEVQIQHAGLDARVSGPMPVLVAPMATDDQPLWSVGASSLAVAYQEKTLLELQHHASSGSASGQFKTAGEMPEFLLSRQTFRDLRPLLDEIGARGEDRRRNWRGRVKVDDEGPRATSDLALTASWDLAFYQSISGRLDVQRLSGDVVIPGAERIALGLNELALQVQASHAEGEDARLQADLNVSTESMGNIRAQASAPLRRFADGGFGMNPTDTLSAELHADIEDLAWISLFTGDELDFGGAVEADATLEASLDGSWSGQGTISGSDLKVVRIDDGMRLLGGTLAARLEDDQLMLDELSFPASLRVVPAEARTAEWITTQPDAQDGWLKVTGQWGLADMLGAIDVELHRFPALQRSDRFAMISGNVHLDAALPSLAITGEVTADAGWFDLDMLGGVASVDGDVVVIRGNQDPDEEVDVPMDIAMDIEVDLGPRFYLTGFGVDSGLVGNLRVIMVDNKLTGLGALRTRGGAIEAYGQRLQLRRGTVTFQGDITNPVLNIEALRTGLAVEAGVRVAGTGKKPRIDLVSYPDVSEVEKLSWLLFGHGPDESEGDMALLVSVGTAFLGGGEPFYRKFGIDEITLRSGELGSVGSILPAESVVSGLNDGASDMEKQFLVATKQLSRGFSISVRQALSDTGTVGRVSYRLMRGVTAELSAGSVNGLAFIHRWFSRD